MLSRFFLPRFTVISSSALLLASLAGGQTKGSLPYQNPALPIEQRIDDLLPRMTKEEKLSQIYDDWGSRGVARLQIPSLLKTEGIHGQSYATGSTIFPHAINMGATFDIGAVSRIGIQTAIESKAAGIRASWSPVLDVARDVRWGRVEETYGESPYLVSRIGVSWIHAFQGEGMISVPKHFAGHGQPIGGRDSHDFGLSERTMRETHLPPFRAAFVEAKAGGVMAAYGVWEGMPDNASNTLLGTILREEWGFDGIVVSDCGGPEHFIRKHAIVQTTAEAAAMAIKAGVSMECGNVYRTGLLDALDQGLVTEAEVDNVVRETLRAKFRLGLFETPGPVKMNWDTLPEYNTASSRALAREVAVKSIALLKNEGGLLPLSKTLKTIAVIGPNAAQAQTGGYSAKTTPGQLVTIVDGIKAKVGPETRVLTALGVASHTALDTSKFEEALALARQADVVVLAVGDRNNREGGDPTSGENKDGATLDFPGVQRQLIKAVQSTGKPIVLVLVNGKPITLAEEAETIPAILVTWYPGQEGGNATADILFGDANPSGRLPVTWPRHTGQVPLTYDYHPSGRRYEYYDMPATPQWRFGYGLSFTQFKYSNLRITPLAGGSDLVKIQTDIENTGGRDGEEVAQLYITDSFASVRTPVCDLQGFQRVALKKGEKKTLVFELTPYQLSLLDANMVRRVEPGVFRIHVGGVSPAVQAKTNDDHKARIGYLNANEGVTGEFTQSQAYAADFTFTLEAPDNVGGGEPFPVTVTVTNNGNLTDVAAVKLFADFQIGAYSFELNPGETKSHTFRPSVYKAGDLTLISGTRLIARPISVKKSPARLEINQVRPVVDDNGVLQITAEARNVGGVNYAGPLVLKVDGKPSGSALSVKLAPGETRKLVLTHTFLQGGIHRIQINELPEQQIIVNSGVALALKAPLIIANLSEGSGKAVKNQVTGTALPLRGETEWAEGRNPASKSLKLPAGGLGIDAQNADIYRKSFTLSAWILVNKFSDGRNEIALFGGQAPMGADQDNTGTALHAGLRNKKMILAFFGRDIDGGKEIPAGKWVNLTYTYDAAEKKGFLYIDGQLDRASKQLPYTGPLEFIGDAPRLGHGDYLLGEIFVAQSCLTNGQIRQMIEKGADTFRTAEYIADWRPIDSQVKTFSAVSELPAGTRLELLVDIGDATGKTLGTSTIELKNGSVSQALEGIPVGDQVRFRARLSTEVWGATPVLRSVTLGGHAWNTTKSFAQGRGPSVLVTDFGQH